MWPSFGWQARVPYGLRTGQDPTHDSCKTDRLTIFFSLQLIVSPFFFFASVHLLYSIFAPSSELCLHSYFPLCAEVITHSAFIVLLLLSSHSALICLRACVMWPRLTVFSWRQTEKPRGSVTCVLTCRPESFHARLWITLLIQQLV